MYVSEVVFDLKKISLLKQNCVFQEMLKLDKQIFPETTDQSFMDFVYDPAAISVYVIQYFCEDRLIGQNIIPILKLETETGMVLIVSSRAGFLPDYRKLDQTLNGAVRLIMNHRMKYPFTPYWFVTTLAQPRLYGLFASRSSHFFPRKDKNSPGEYREMLNFIAQRQPNVEQRGEDIYIQDCNLPVPSADELMHCGIVPDSHSAFFTKHAPDWFYGKGMICLCKLDGRTLTETAMNVFLDRRLS